jgi:multiple sugar transport system substrate-binding protein
MQKKLLFMLAMLLVISACLFSCTPQPAPSTGVTLKCALIGFGDYERLYQEIPKFEAQTGIKVDVVFKGNLFELDKKFKKDFEAGTVDYDVISDHSSFYSQYTDYLEPLNSYFTSDELADFIPRLLNIATRDGNIYLIPRHADISCLVYRTDLFADPDNQRTFKEQYGRDLAVPKTWDEFVQVAKFFSKNNGIYGTAFAGKEEALTGRFNEVLAANGGNFISDGGTASFNSDEGVKTAEMFKDLYQSGCMPPDTFNYLWDDLAKMFATGKIAMYLEWYNYQPYFQDKDTSKVAGKFDIARSPVGQADQHSGWTGVHGFSITKASQHKQEAAELIKFLTSVDNEGLEATEGYLPVRTSVWDKIINQVNSSGDEFQKKRLVLARLQFSEDSFTPPLIAQWVPASDIFYPTLQQIMQNKIPVKQGLDAVASQVNTLLKSNPQ